MLDIIALLPDAVANQIAAGEVVQRPASVVKELVENAIDAGAGTINLVIKDAGKTLIQVTDNGCGMSETDARMSFERHATSKIKSANDLFALHTKGFRGEALASIAAIAHVTLKTKRHEDELGTKIEIEGSEVAEQSPVNCPVGTSFLVKNLFYNVPARRNFLKSNAVETRHIIDEFIRVALTHPDVEMILTHNDIEVYNLPKGSLRQRIVATFGNKQNQKLVPITESTDIVDIQGFIGKPEFSKKTRGEQFIFVNNRFIKNTYLNHAISTAYKELISRDHHPSYFLYLTVDPASIDVNIHPTKTEIKFEEEKFIYAIVHSAVRLSLGKYNITPTLDFEQETSFNAPLLKEDQEIKVPTITVNPDFNPFKENDSSRERSAITPGNSDTSNTSFQSKKDRDGSNWESLYQINTEFDSQNKGLQEINENFEFDSEVEPQQQVIDVEWTGESSVEKSSTPPIQVHNKYILSHIKSGFFLIDQNKAHQRILYEKFIQDLALNRGNSQQQLFPQSIEFAPSDFELICVVLDDIRALGFDVEKLGKNTLAVNGLPADAKDANPKDLIESILEQYKLESSDLILKKREALAKSLAYSVAIRPGKKMSISEMNDLVDRLFACEMPYYAPNGKPTIVTFTLDELSKKFEK